jgi:uncharacterized protein (DUF427 family)
MVKATWNGAVIAESGETVVVEGNHYFPHGSVNEEFLLPSGRTTECVWKGTAHYYTLEVAGERNTDAAWYYPDPSHDAGNIRGHVAFWNGVTVGD